MNLLILKTEIETDPLARGYTGMSDLEVANDLNTEYRPHERPVLSSAEIYELTNSTEFQALTDPQKVYVRDIWGLGDSISVVSGSKARTVYVTIFGAGSNTIATLSAYINQIISRAQELGIGHVTPGDVALAKGGIW
jgi:hypothetical protein